MTAPIQRPRINPATKARIANLLREGRTVAAVARICDVSTFSVTGIGRKEGIDYVRSAPGEHWANRNAPQQVKPAMSLVQTEEQKWRGAAYAARWGGGYVR